MSPNFLTRITQIFKLKGMGSPSQMAAGLCLGLMVGLLPKDSLAPWLILVVGVFSTVNISTVLIGWGSGWLLIPLVDRVADPAGLYLLQWPPLQPFIAQMTRLPVCELFRLENSVTTGTLMLGLLAAMPLFWLARWVFCRIRPLLVSFFERHFATRWLVAE